MNGKIFWCTFIIAFVIVFVGLFSLFAYMFSAESQRYEYNPAWGRIDPYSASEIADR